VGCSTRIERVQKNPARAEGFAGFLAGTSGLVGPLPPNSGLAHIEVSDRGGAPWFTTEPVTPGRVVTPLTVGAPDPADSSPGAVLEGGVALGVTVIHGSVMASAMDNQTQRAYRVLFEENTDGRRRARIETYTLAHDGNGGVSIIPEHVWVDGEGNLTSETISYGRPFAPDLPMITSGVPDVAGFAFSGYEPFRYEVPRAVFP
jgi:hypothetical protein